MGLTKPRAYQIFDIDYKQSVRVITLTNITLTGGAPSSVDGVNLSVGDRILVAGQSTGAQNGLYQVSVLGTGSDGTWIRSVDANQTGEVDAGMIVMVTEGEVYKDTQWKLTTNDPITIGVTALVFEQNSAFAFGNIFANGTAVLADIVGDTVTFTPANNLIITANATSDIITFSVSQSPDFTGNFVVSGTVGSNLIPTANVTYNLGNTTNRWNDIWLSNSTIYLGNAQISANATSLILTTPEGAQTVFSGSTANISASTVTATGNITGGNLITSGILSVTGNANVGNLSINSANANIGPLSTTAGWYLETSFSVSAQESEPRGVFFKSDGSRMYVCGNAGDDIIQYDLGTAWDVSTATYSNAFVVSGQASTPYDVSLSADGTKMWVLDGGNDAVDQYSLSSAWDVGSATYDNITFSVAGQETNPLGFWFRPDGTKMYVTGSTGDDVNEYNLSSAGNVATASFLQVSSSLAVYETAPEGLAFSSDGAKMWIVGSTFQRITQFDLATPWDVSTLSFNSYLPVATSGTFLIVGASGLYVNESAGVAYVSDYQNDRIFQYATDTPTGQFYGPQWTAQNDFTTGNNLSVNQNIWIGGSGRIVGTLTSQTSLNSPAFATTTSTGTTSLITGTTTGIINFATGITTGTLNQMTAQTTGIYTLGGTGATGAINIGRSTANQSIIIANGVTGSGNVKTIDIGTLGASGSNTTITIGSATAGAVTTTTIYGNTAAGNVTTTGLIEATGNVSGGNITTAGLVSAGTTVTATGNVSGGNLVTAGLVSAGTTVTATGNVSGGNLTTAGRVDATGNITGGNIATGGIGVFVGNVVFGAEANTRNSGFLGHGTDSFGFTSEFNNAVFLRNEQTTTEQTLYLGDTGTSSTSTLFGIASGTGNGTPVLTLSGIGNLTVANVTPTGVVSATGNVSGGNLITAGQITATGNVSGGNLLLTGNIFDSGTSLQINTTTAANISLAPNSTIVLTATTTGANVTGTLNATGNANVGNLGTTGLITATGNITGGNITTAGNVSANYFLGNVACASGIFTTKIFNGNSEANIVSAGGNLEISIGGVDDIVTVTSLGLQTTGTLTATGNITGGNIATAGVITATGNITGGNIATAGVITATGNITGGNLLVNNNVVITGNLSVLGTETIFNVNTLTVNDKDIVVANNVTGGANVNGAGLQAGNPAVATWFFNNATTSWQSNIAITPTANGTLDLGGTSNRWGNAWVTTLTATGNANVGNIGATNIVGTLSTAAQPNITSLGTLTSLSVTGNVSTGNVSGTLLTGTLATAAQPNITSVGTLTSLSVTGNVSGGNLTTSGLISATGNITGGNLSGTSIAGTLTTAAQTNITSVGTLTSLAVTASNIAALITDSFATASSVRQFRVKSGARELGLAANLGAGSYNNLVDSADLAIIATGSAQGNANLTISPWASATSGIRISSVSNVATITIAAATINNSGNIFSTGNIQGANIVSNSGVSGTTVTATGNITGGNINTGARVVATGNVTGGNLTTAGRVDATGNVAGGNLTTAGRVDATGNITGGNLTTAGVVSATGNITGGNLTTAGVVSATGNIQTAANVVYANAAGSPQAYQFYNSAADSIDTVFI